ncbi:ParB N-terminal domain-containing protein [Escherichia coli]|nr:ParB N-terminal domain-containing protein [Escherichia coli]EKB2311904.1 ParB N-terminal domain-containing protein [Escherichia coli]EKQ5286746.1 ParB N-terminal domain-containing protein [Escherichia coli]SQM97515.1 phage terminase [Escherichia coli]HCO5527108.1 ParB N-terminal domain-containing protein [Escherichia coli]
MSEKLKIVYRPLQELSPYAHNARTHSTEQVAQLVESIKQFGWTNPVLIDEKGEIIAGHGRVMAAEMLKMDSVPVIVLSGLTDEQKKAYRLADNRLPMNAGWDEDLLRMELSDLINADFDVSLTGFIPTEIDELLTDVLPGTGNEEEPYTTKIDTPVTNLTSGTVYHQFDRKLNNCEEVEQPGEPIYIGMDFNVGKMAGIVHVLRLGLPCAVTEIINAYDTPDMIRLIKERFWLYDGHDYRKVREIYIYPDASGDSRKSSNASTTDIAQLKQAGFNVVVNSSNPPVKDRVNSMNAMFCNANGERRYKVNVKRCPVYAESLEQQVWDDKGEPDKKSGNDHPNDAGGYFIVKQFPIVKPTGRVTSLRI